MCNLTVLPNLHFEFELEDEMVRLYIKLPMHIFQKSRILERIKRDYIWITGAGKETEGKLCFLFSHESFLYLFFLLQVVYVS